MVIAHFKELWLEINTLCKILCDPLNEFFGLRETSCAAMGLF